MAFSNPWKNRPKKFHSTQRKKGEAFATAMERSAEASHGETSRGVRREGALEVSQSGEFAVARPRTLFRAMFRSKTFVLVMFKFVILAE